MGPVDIPPGLVVAEDRGVIQLRGKMGPYFAPTPGLATLDAHKLVRPELLVELASVLSKALAGTAATSQEIALPRDGGVARVVLDAFPVGADGAVGRCALVLFRDVGAAPLPDMRAAIRMFGGFLNGRFSPRTLP